MAVEAGGAFRFARDVDPARAAKSPGMRHARTVRSGFAGFLARLPA
jgi:hypothetical protein